MIQFTCIKNLYENCPQRSHELTNVAYGRYLGHVYRQTQEILTVSVCAPNTGRGGVGPDSRGRIAFHFKSSLILSVTPVGL